MQITAAQISQLVQGQTEGDDQALVTAPGKIENSRSGDVSFLANPRYLPHIYETQASVVIIPADLKLEHPVKCTVIRHPMPYYAFCQVLDKWFNPHAVRTGIHPTAILSETASIGKDVYIAPYVVIEEGATIGDGVQLYPHVYIGRNASVGKNTVFHAGVKLYAECHVGDACIIHAGTAIGSDGFGFAPAPDGSYAKIPQIGNVIIGNHVETGSNCSIDRATMGATIIGNGVKLDNLVQIAHNVEIGDHSVIAGQSGVAGSTKVGKHCVIGAQVGVVGHIVISDRTQIGGQSGVTKTLREPGGQYLGSPALPLKDAMKSHVIYRNLPELDQRVRNLEKKQNNNDTTHT